MQDIEIIQRRNKEAVQEAATKAAESGKFVVTKFTGLNFVDYAAFDTEGECNQAALEWVNDGAGHRAEFIHPTN